MPHRSRPVLIVEDDKDIRDVLLLFLSKAGYKVRACEDRQTALQMIQKDQDIFCVLLDWHMPGMDCDEFMRALHEIAFKGHVIMLSGGYDAEEYAKRCGIVCVERKPLDFERLHNLLRDCKDCKPQQVAS